MAAGRRSASAGWAVAAIPALGAGVLVLASTMSTVSFADAEIPEERISVAVGALAAPTYQAVVEGVGAASGPDAMYRVNWSDAADIGSPGFGLLDDLERRGLEVRATRTGTSRRPTTASRNQPRPTPRSIWRPGPTSSVWRQVPFAVEVATYEPRDAAELARYHQTRRRLIDRLADEGLNEVIEQVDYNLFGGSLNPNLSDEDIADFTTLLDLGQPMSVFIAPATADAPP